MQTNRLSSKKRRRRNVSGMTLVEIMVVIIIMAMIATAVGVAVIPKLNQAKVNQARTDAATVAGAVNMWLADHNGNDCPTMEELIENGDISRNQNHKDPWDHDFQISCEGREPEVHSAGPDGNFGTDDDI
jgi:general secretion pathway protein G